MTTTAPGTVEPLIRRYRDDDEDQVLELLALCLSGWRIPHARELFRWKHVHGPFGPSRGWVAEEDGRIIGFGTGIAWQLRYHGRQLRAGWDVDMVVHPDRQRRGIGVAMLVHGYQQEDRTGEDVHFSHGNVLSSKMVERVGFDPGTTIAVHMAPLRPWRLAAPRGGYRPRPVDTTRLCPAEAVLEDAAAVEDLIERSQPSDRLVTARSVDHLRWRYVDIPGDRYVATSVRGRDGRLRGLLFGRGVTPQDTGVLEYFEVSELIVPESDPAAQAALLRQVWRVDAAYAIAALPIAPTGRADALRTGFPVQRDRAWNFRARAIADGLPADIERPRRWLLALGDLAIM